MTNKRTLLGAFTLGIAAISMAYFIYSKTSASPFPINSPRAATAAIDRLADAIEKNDEQKAFALLAKRNGPSKTTISYHICSEALTKTLALTWFLT